MYTKVLAGIEALQYSLMWFRKKVYMCMCACIAHTRHWSSDPYFFLALPHPFFFCLQPVSFCSVSKIAGGRSYYGHGLCEEAREAHFNFCGPDHKFWSISFQTWLPVEIIQEVLNKYQCLDTFLEIVI